MPAEISMLPDEECFKLKLTVSPNASKSEVINLVEDTLHLKVAAPPTKGKANKELVSFLSKKLKLAKNDVLLVSGHTTRQKMIAVYGIEKHKALRKLLK